MLWRVEGWTATYLRRERKRTSAKHRVPGKRALCPRSDPVESGSSGSRHGPAGYVDARWLDDAIGLRGSRSPIWGSRVELRCPLCLANIQPTAISGAALGERHISGGKELRC